jgi:hypothetical protein
MREGPQAPPGWYDYDETRQGYWDGQAWVEFRPKSQPKAPPGWYDYDASRQAYWNGERWGEFRPKPENQAPGPLRPEPVAQSRASPGWYDYDAQARRIGPDRNGASSGRSQGSCIRFSPSTPGGR